MTDLLLADLHLSPHKRDRYRLDFLDRLPDIAHWCGAEIIFILGDLTEQKDNHGGKLVNEVVDRLDRVAAQFPLIILMGNHDLDASDPYFAFLSKIRDIEFVTAPTQLGNRFLIPHTRNPRAWRALNYSGVNRIYTHASFNGATMEGGREVENGVPVNTLPKLPIYSGDIHVPQQLLNVVYVGAPYTIKFGDQFEPRALLVDAKGWKSIPLQGPMKRLLHVDEHDRCSGTAYEGDIVRIELALRPEDYSRIEEIRSYWQDYCADWGFILDSIRPQLVRDENVAVLTRQTSRRSDEEIVYDYCERQQADQATQQLGLELL